MRNAIVGLIVGACTVSGCGGGETGPPTGPTPTVSSVTVSLRDVVLVGTTAAATATATLTNGQTQSVTTGWRSDATSIASVTDAGTVTGVANGEATITVGSGGRDGSKRIRVAPNYDGQWQGTQIVTACTATGDFQGTCEEEGGVVGLPFPVGLLGRHPGDLAVSGEFTIEGLQFPTFTTQIEADGSSRFSATTVVEGVRAEASWQMNSTQNGRSSGTIREKYSLPGIASGEVTYDSTFADVNRTGTTAGPSSSAAAPIVKRRINPRRPR